MILIYCCVLFMVIKTVLVSYRDSLVFRHNNGLLCNRYKNGNECVEFVKILFFLFFAGCSSKLSSSAAPESNKISCFHPYCGVNYGEVDKIGGMELKKVIVIHRHGDRAPVRIIDKCWYDELCKVCNYDAKNKKIYDCKDRKCKNGDLTLKGYEQLKKLGNFIKKTYRNLLLDVHSSKDLEFRATGVPRTHSSLHAVLTGVVNIENLQNVTIPAEDSLLMLGECPSLRSIMEIKDIDHYKDLRVKGGKDPERIADNLWAHKCNNLPINCDLMDCDSTKNMNYLDSNYKSWYSKSKIAAGDEDMRQILFGRFAKDLLAAVNSDKKIHIFSAHDNSINMILIGLRTGVYERPPYASAIIIEKWVKKDDFFIRVIYNGSVINIPMSDNNLVRKDVFCEYLQKIGITGRECSYLCENYS